MAILSIINDKIDIILSNINDKYVLNILNGLKTK